MPSTGKSLEEHDPRQLTGARRPSAFVLQRLAIGRYLSVPGAPSGLLKPIWRSILPPKQRKPPQG